MDQILVVDDDIGFRGLVRTILAAEGHSIAMAGSVADAIAACQARQFHLIVCDLRLPGPDGLDLLRWSKEHQPAVPVVMITGFGTVASAVEAMKLGAEDYIGKPLSSPDELRIVVRKALDHRRTVRDNESLREAQNERFACGALVAAHPSMRRVLDLARRVAPTPATVLISGESGTGKEIIARCIHNNSPRAANAFVAVNCAALAPSLIESELFGHEKGAFTGAAAQHIGRFERAHGGTLFLDEIGELDGNLQSKLLRALQERTFERVGGTRQITVDVRLIAATNRDLQKQIANGRFREDLYYRLNLFPIELPPLRERGSDIPELARFFLARACRSLRKPELRLTTGAERVLSAYRWPGNVRELENVMERMAILCDEAVKAEDLPLTAEGPAGAALFKDIEKKAILEALRANSGNRTKAAQQLGISLRTLQYRLKDYALAEEDPNSD